MFWLTTCYPCGMEMKAISGKYNQWKKEANFNFYAISTDWPKNEQSFINRVQKKNFPWESYWDFNKEFKYIMPGKLNGLPQVFLLDKNGNIAAGTSTGGMMMKKWGRIGDSPIIGAGTYANNATCGVSCTGHGEFFIRYAVAYDISAMMEYGGMTFQDAAEEVVNKKLVEAGGSGGIIGVDKDGNVAMPFNTKGMYQSC